MRVSGFSLKGVRYGRSELIFKFVLIFSICMVMYFRIFCNSFQYI